MKKILLTAFFAFFTMKLFSQQFVAANNNDETIQKESANTLESLSSVVSSDNSVSSNDNDEITQKESFFEQKIISPLNLSVNIDDEIYQILENCQSRGLCSFLPNVKPYTQKRIVDAINEILENSNKLSQTEISILQKHLDKYTITKKTTFSKTKINIYNEFKNQPFSFNYNFNLETVVSGGVYNKSDFNQVGFDFMPEFSFYGDLSKYISYAVYPIFDITQMKLYEVGDDYFIGYNWFDKYYTEDGKSYEVGDYTDSLVDDDIAETYAKYGNGPQKRTIKTFKNNSYLPFSYKHPWGGQIYFFSNFSASGLEGWPESIALTGNINTEIRSSLFENKLNIGFGKISRDWASMDNGSSLVLNKRAQPIVGFDISVELFKFLKFSAMVGGLEYPNQDYIARSGWAGGVEDDRLWQNGFSINMVELDFKYLHLDFGSNVLWPKRFELGYILPLMVYVEYQNHLGDNDNCALFGDIKLRMPKIGEIWASLYLDEINVNDPIKQTRVMYAGQLGAKIPIPKLPFATISMRYTKIEPFCYTHHSINYTPWYAHYICENYTNAGDCLGYYLPPNSDEIFINFETMPLAHLKTSFTYQFIRHGADYGSQQVQGSSLYSELCNFNRDSIEKYFLHDGAYNWIHIVNLSAYYESRKLKTHFDIFGSVGFVYSYYTMIDDENYEMTVLGNHKADTNTKFYVVDTNEYPIQYGAVITAGIKLWK